MNRVLIVEDDSVVAHIYSHKFATAGFQVQTAGDAETGLELLHTFQPTVVVLDLLLPRMSGVEFTKQVRALPEFQFLPIIVFSNTYMTNLVQDAWQAGATKCLSKANCTPKQVVDVVVSALTLSRHKPAAPGPRKTAEAEETSPGVSDAEFQADLRGTFAHGLPETLADLRKLLKALVKADEEQRRIKAAQELYRRVHALTGSAGTAGFARIAQMADALEALLRELHEKPKNLTASTLRTVAAAVDFLGVLFAQDPEAPPAKAEPPSILVVDDEAISRRAVVHALEKAKLKAVSVEDPQAAFDLLRERHFDLVLLDVDMPGLSGYELCAKLRGLPAHKTTPVIFVTSLTTLASRANSTMSGGNDFIAKPFLFIELAVKALVYVLRTQLPAPEAGNPPAPSAG